MKTVAGDAGSSVGVRSCGVRSERRSAGSAGYDRECDFEFACGGGVSSDRPRLIPDDSFVERTEIDQAAADYEARLNS
jgi:hypothetical protein